MKYDENEFNDEITPSTDDIVDYYRRLEEAKDLTADISHDTDNDNHEETDTVSDDESEQMLVSPIESDYTVPANNSRKNNILFFSITTAVSMIILAVVFFAGASVYKAEEDINFELAHMRDSSARYEDAKKRIEDTDEAIQQLNAEIEEKQTELNTLTEYESDTGEIKSRLNVLTEEMNDLNEDIKKREKTITELDSSIAKKSLITCTLSPGIYIVGKNINAGQYNAVGDGIFTTAGADGGLKINTVLTTEPFTCSLDDGDTVKLETTAKFIPAQ